MSIPSSARRFVIAIFTTGLLLLLPDFGLAEAPADPLRIGWAQIDITPKGKVALGGQGYVRVTSTVRDPLTATAQALEAPYSKDKKGIIFIGCDLRSITETIRDGVRAQLRKDLPEVDSMRIILNATHTHNAPPLSHYGVKLDAMDEPEYAEFAIPLLAKVAKQAWENRAPAGVSFGMAYAVVGHNRIMAYDDGKSKMGGNTAQPDFSHAEGFEDHSLQLLYTWNPAGKMTGVIVNIASPSQVSGSEYVISADFWHDVRLELRKRHGDGLFVFPQVSAAGDQMSREYIYNRAEQRMEALTGMDRRTRIAHRIADAVDSIHDVMKKNIEWKPVLAHHSEIVPLTRRKITPEEIAIARAGVAELEKTKAENDAALAANPALVNDAAWMKASTRLAWVKNRHQATLDRNKSLAGDPTSPTELHVVRLGDMVFAHNPFELYLDFGIQMKTRNKAVQTFVVQLAGQGTYVPTHRSVSGGAYGAVPPSNRVGPEGGRELVNWVVEKCDELWKTK